MPHSAWKIRESNSWPARADRVGGDEDTISLDEFHALADAKLEEGLLMAEENIEFKGDADVSDGVLRVTIEVVLNYNLIII